MKIMKIILIVFIGILIEQGIIDLFEKEKKRDEGETKAKGVIVVGLLIIETMLIFSGGIV